MADFNSIFDCVFNEEIKINPYSEIALQSASFPLANRFLNIDASNDTLTYQVQNGVSHTINITHGTYTKFNATRLLEQITDKTCNASVSFQFSDDTYRKAEEGKELFQQLRETKGMEHDGLILPERVAETYFHLSQQHRSAWSHEVDIRAFSDTAWWNH